MAPPLSQPGPPEHQDVGVPVVVVVGLQEVVPSVQAGEAHLDAALGEGAAAVVLVVAQPRARIAAGGDQVQVAVAVEVLGDAAAARLEADQAPLERGVVEAREGLGRLEVLGRDPLLGGDALGVSAQGHVGQVQEPAGGGILGLDREDLPQEGDGLQRALPILVHARAPQGQDAALPGVLLHVVPLLTQAQPGHGQLEGGRPDGRLGQLAAEGGELRAGHRQGLDRRPGVAQLQLVIGELASEPEALPGRLLGQRADLGAERAGLGVPRKGVLLPRLGPHRVQERQHPAVALGRPRPGGRRLLRRVRRHRSGPRAGGADADRKQYQNGTRGSVHGPACLAPGASRTVYGGGARVRARGRREGSGDHGSISTWPRRRSSRVSRRRIRRGSPSRISTSAGRGRAL